MKQNKYDDERFFENYSRMPRSVGGLGAAGEWSELRTMLPELAGKRLLDLGCGYGWHGRYAREQGARSAVGVDLSDKMLARAREMTDDPAISYVRGGIEDIDFADGAFDVVLSSLALHYVADFGAVCRGVRRWLASGGAFVFTVEHPVFTALAAQDWHYGPQGEKLHWPLDRYHEAGPRVARFLDHDVVKYHRTVSDYVNALIDADFRIDRLSELRPTPDMLQQHPEWADEARRPMFLLVAAGKA
ncbi:class I SAM-dependent methyltransferase [Cohnella sp. JJ-181]|uniref:class I SAM-dependent methyltransferase n=1 Tax=Cohnella rhizoplanae TaxID=2974897 RepID=UPI0022FF579F|nr:class I SAM-dependent methyltransferase [Cohnella sp. JJ-181]CAI6083783.1 2-methoxy-6-polyprenyl-1,4-benzoquinol methylase, mitochondrial [Cohnella sp. JJ-181]